MARIDGNPTVSILLSTSTTCPLPFKFGSGYKIRVKAASEDTDSVVDWFSKNYPAPERVLTSPDSDICELKFKAGDLKLSEAFAKLEEVCCLRVGRVSKMMETNNPHHNNHHRIWGTLALCRTQSRRHRSTMYSTQLPCKSMNLIIDEGSFCPHVHISLPSYLRPAVVFHFTRAGGFHGGRHLGRGGGKP